MVESITREYTVRRGDVWVGETFRFISSQGTGFWSSYAVRAQIRSTATSATVVHEFTLNPAVTAEGSNGILTIGLSLTANETAAITPGNYVGDIEVSSSQLPKSTLISFSFALVADITR